MSAQPIGIRQAVYTIYQDQAVISARKGHPPPTPKYHFKWLWIGWRKLKWKLKWNVQYPFNILSKIVQEATMQWSKKRCKGKGAPARSAIRTSRCKLEKYRSAHLFYRNKRWMGRCECHQGRSNHSAPINDHIILELFAFYKLWPNSVSSINNQYIHNYLIFRVVVWSPFLLLYTWKS